MHVLAETPKSIFFTLLYMFTTAKTQAFEIPALYSRGSPIRTNNIDVFRSRKQILYKQFVLAKLYSFKACKNYFRKNIKSVGFSNPQNFLRVRSPVKKVVLIIIKTKDFLRIVSNKNFLVKFLQI